MSDQKDGGRILLFDPSLRRAKKVNQAARSSDILEAIQSVSILSCMPEHLNVRLTLTPGFDIKKLGSLSIIPLDKQGQEIWFECVIFSALSVSCTDIEDVVNAVLKPVHTQSNVFELAHLVPGATIKLIFISDQFICESNGQRRRISTPGAIEALRRQRGRTFAVTIPGHATR